MGVSVYKTHGITVKYQNNSPEVLEALKRATIRGLEAWGVMGEEYARKELKRPKAHKDGSVRNNIITQNLYKNINHVVQQAGKGYTVILGVNKGVDYAGYVELGTRNTWAYPYLKPACTQHTGEYKQILENSLKNA